jgi:4-hydroxy-2-oxoheptanedioate aldolase
LTGFHSAVRSRWEAGAPAVGAWCSIPAALSAEVVGQAGFDFVCADLQHGLADLGSAAAMLQAISITGADPFVRVPGNEPWLIMRALDLGAVGIVVPLVGSAEEAARAARACRYPPAGARSWGPVRVASTKATDAGACNERVLCLPMVETPEGVANLEAICSVPGVDGIYVGPSDLALSHGIAPGAELEKLLATIVATARKCGVPAGIHVRSGAAARQRAEEGFLLAGIATDRELLWRASLAELAAARGTEREAGRPPAEGLLRASVTYASD